MNQVAANRGVASARWGLLLLIGCGGSASSGTGTTGSAAVDGTWDIVSYATESLAPSSATVANGKLTGSVTFAGASPSCSRTLEFVIQGDSMSGSSTPAGTTGACAGATTTAVTGTRAVRQPDSDTPWNGTWTIRQGSASEGELTIAGLSATSGKFTLSVASGVATGSGEKKYTFVARRR